MMFLSNFGGASMNIHKSSEDYLERIMMLREEKAYVRSVDIAIALSVTKPSVSYAMKQLRESGYITMDDDNYIFLTVAGEKIAKQIYHRHRVLTSFLKSLGVEDNIAREDACKVEHDLSEESFAAICNHMNEQSSPV